MNQDEITRAPAPLEKAQEVARTRERPWPLTAFLVLSLLIAIVGSIYSAASISSAMTKMPEHLQWLVQGLLVIGGLRGVALIALWFWRRWGAYLYGACTATTVSLMLFNGLPLVLAAGAVTGLILLILVTRSTWSQFE